MDNGRDGCKVTENFSQVDQGRNKGVFQLLTERNFFKLFVKDEDCEYVFYMTHCVWKQRQISSVRRVANVK
jgi:hypothetical protein